MIYDSILGTIGRTPVVRVNRLAPEGVTMYVKCEFFNPLSSVKDRLAIAIIEDAERRGALKPGQTVIEATSGNTGIALAMVCAAKGYPFVAVMVETFSVERRKIMRMLGAKVVLTPAAERGSGMVRRAKELADDAHLGMFEERKGQAVAVADTGLVEHATAVDEDVEGPARHAHRHARGLVRQSLQPDVQFLRHHQ